MANNNKELYISGESRKREPNRKTLSELKGIGRKMKLLNVDQYKKQDKHILVERILKGKQLSDESKNVLLEIANHKKLNINSSMSKKDILQKISKPELTDFNKTKLREIAKEKGVQLRNQMSKEDIIERLKNPTDYYTIQKLKQVAVNNNINVPDNISKPNLINILAERNLITTTPITAQESNLGVMASNIPIELIRAVKKKARNAREALINFKHYIKNLESYNLDASRLKKLTKTLEKKERQAKEEHDRIFYI